MIENVELAYCMAKLEDAIREEKYSISVYTRVVGEDSTSKKMVTRWSTMIDAFEAAFGVSYFDLH